MKKKGFRLFRNRRLEALEERVRRLEEQAEEARAGTGTGTASTETGVPLETVLREYLWGEEE